MQWVFLPMLTLHDQAFMAQCSRRWRDIVARYNPRRVFGLKQIQLGYAIAQPVRSKLEQSERDARLRLKRVRDAMLSPNTHAHDRAQYYRIQQCIRTLKRAMNMHGYAMIGAGYITGADLELLSRGYCSEMLPYTHANAVRYLIMHSIVSFAQTCFLLIDNGHITFQEIFAFETIYVMRNYYDTDLTETDMTRWSTQRRVYESDAGSLIIQSILDRSITYAQACQCSYVIYMQWKHKRNMPYAMHQLWRRMLRDGFATEMLCKHGFFQRHTDILQRPNVFARIQQLRRQNFKPIAEVCRGGNSIQVMDALTKRVLELYEC